MLVLSSSQTLRGYSFYISEVLFVPIYQNYVDQGDGLVSTKSAGEWILGHGEWEFLKIVGGGNICVIMTILMSLSNCMLQTFLPLFRKN